MKTRKHRKWYQLNGMLRAGKFESVIECPVAIYYVCPKDFELKTVTNTPYFVACKGDSPSVDKKTARITAKYPINRLYCIAGVGPTDMENVRKQLNERLKGV